MNSTGNEKCMFFLFFDNFFKSYDEQIEHKLKLKLFECQLTSKCYKFMDFRNLFYYLVIFNGRCFCLFDLNCFDEHSTSIWRNNWRKSWISTTFRPRLDGNSTTIRNFDESLTRIRKESEMLTETWRQTTHKRLPFNST